jgi:hypothetical protein
MSFVQIAQERREMEVKIEKLEAENASLKEVLNKIAFDKSPPWDSSDLKSIAREALNHKPDDR